MIVPTPFLRSALFPLSWLYGLGVRGRNLLFSWGIHKEEEFPLPVICIGNLTVGGTGKTPHTEYLIRLLNQLDTAVLSRGYGRKTKGFILASPATTAREIGDEPYQIHQKFPEVTVAVQEKRAEGIRRLMQEHHPQVILLDDAYQHRYVKAGLNILLTDYNRLMTRDHLLPAGRLREPLCGKDRAHILIITKCPALSAEEQEALREEMKLSAHQHLFFSQITYGESQAVFQGKTLGWDQLAADTPVLLLAGIANPAPLLAQVQKHTKNVKLLEFRDHHSFTPRELKDIQETLAGMGPDALLLTTEKDAARLKGMSLSPALQSRMYEVPIQVQITSDQQEDFDNLIINFVEHFNPVCKEQR